MLVECPECKGTIEVAFSNIINDDLALEENIICPYCNKKLNQVNPLKKTSEISHPTASQ
ncbi:MAG: hypothetical protein ACC612_09795 [Methanomethylovorans sp.]|uniref:hypothetical protein n=1 Tax=Methanomethylovorans sp. TaxID=2758717 RepID=UPI003530DD0F